jgi:citrate lyase beta subunit
MHRSYLFVPGHNEKLLDRVFDAGADYARLDDEVGLRTQTEFARSLGLFGKSAIHPRQLAALHDVFTPSAQELKWARTVVDAFERARGEVVKLPDGEFVDLPVAQRAQRLLELARALQPAPDHPAPTRRQEHEVRQPSAAHHS